MFTSVGRQTTGSDRLSYLVVKSYLFVILPIAVCAARARSIGGMNPKPRPRE